MATATSPVVHTQFQLDKAEFLYEPFPIGCIRPVFADDMYRELERTWPDLELFAFMAKLGKKYSLSEVNNPELYHKFLAETPVWKALYDEVKAPHFARSIIRVLKDAYIDLGIGSDIKVNEAPKKGGLRETLSRWMLNLSPHKASGLKTRFEFSMLPADGGHIKPHTDSPGKLITLVMAFPGDDWNPAFGGGTTMLRPKDVKQAFNHLNKQGEFDEMETLHTFPFQPNQCVIFVKTFNSWHAVSPMTGHGSPLMRKTLTVNIEIA